MSQTADLADALQALPTHRVRTVNTSQDSGNKIHDSATAARYGFRGGLVPGTLVYAHMTTPLVRHFGAAWLDAGEAELRLLQPAYDGEWLTVSGRPDGSAGGPGGSDGTRHVVEVRNEAGTLLATLTSRQGEPPPPDARAGVGAAPPGGAPVPISWEAVRVDEPLRALAWAPSRAELEAWCAAAGDALPLYREGDAPRLHPGLVLQGANRVFSTHYALNPWIHVGSRVVQRGPVRPGNPVEIRAVPTRKEERKGHQIVTLYVVFLADGAPVVEVEHTAIFTVRPVAA